MIGWEFILLYLVAGSVAGFLAGLLGIGGLVRALYDLAQGQDA